MNTWTCSVSRDDKRADRSAASVVRRRRISEKLLAAVMNSPKEEAPSSGWGASEDRA